MSSVDVMSDPDGAVRDHVDPGRPARAGQWLWTDSEDKHASVVVPSHDLLGGHHHQRAFPFPGEPRLIAARGLVTVVVAAHDSPLEFVSPRAVFLEDLSRSVDADETRIRMGAVDADRDVRVLAQVATLGS